MKIIQGVVIDVVDKGTGDKLWAIVAIQETSKDRDGIDITETVKCRVFGDAVKGGIHNAYRMHKGAEVFAPVNVSYDAAYNQINYQIAGIPLRLAEQRPVDNRQATPASTVKPAVS